MVKPAFAPLYLCIPTNGRPALLARCLESLLPVIKRNREQLSLLVSDDAKSEQEKVDPSLLDALRRETGATVILQSDADKLELSRAISRSSGVSETLLSFALGRYGTQDAPSYGGNQNAIRLRCGRSIRIVVDDDIVWHPTRREGPDEQNQVDGIGDVTTYYDVTSDLYSDLKAGDDDLLARMLSGFYGPTGSDRIAVATPGIYGDPATTSNFAVALNPNSVTRGLVLKDDVSYRRARTSRLAIRQAGRDHETPLQGFMSAIYAIDGRLDLPPFFPTHRGTDRAFGNLAGALEPDLRRLHVAVSVGHWPDSPRVSSEFGPYWRLCDLLDVYLARFLAAHVADGERRSLARFGQFLIHVSRRTPDANFVHDLSECRKRLLEDYSARLLSLLQSGAPTVRAVQHDLARQLLTIHGPAYADVAIPEDWMPQEDLLARVRSLRTALTEFGWLCVEWRRAVEAAETAAYSEAA